MLIFCFLATEGPAGRPLPWARLSIESKPRAPSKRHPPRRPAWTLWRRKISSHLPSWSTKHASKQSKEKKKKTRYVIFILNHFFISLNGNNRYIRWPIVHCTDWQMYPLQQNDSIESISYRPINVYVWNFAIRFKRLCLYSVSFVSCLMLKVNLIFYSMCSWLILIYER